MDLVAFYATYAVYGHTGSDTMDSIILIYRDKCVRVRINLAEMRGTDFGEEYTRRVSVFESIERKQLADWQSFCRFALQPCITLIEMLAPPEEANDAYTIQDVLTTKSWELRYISKENGTLGAEIVSGPTYLSAYGLGRKPTEDLRLLLSATHMIPQFRACDVKVFPEDNRPRGPNNTRGPPRKVRAPDGMMCEFKPLQTFNEAEFPKELTVLEQITTAGLHRQLRVPQLAGVVVIEAEDAEAVTVGGLLTHWIEGSALVHPVNVQAQENHARWKKQVVDIVEQLHEHNITLGHINQNFILIDEAGNARLVDFWGDGKLDSIGTEDSKGEDWQGVRKSFDEWLVQAVLEQ